MFVSQFKIFLNTILDVRLLNPREQFKGAVCRIQQHLLSFCKRSLAPAAGRSRQLRQSDSSGERPRDAGEVLITGQTFFFSTYKQLLSLVSTAMKSGLNVKSRGTPNRSQYRPQGQKLEKAEHPFWSLPAVHPLAQVGRTTPEAHNRLY